MHMFSPSVLKSSEIVGTFIQARFVDLQPWACATVYSVDSWYVNISSAAMIRLLKTLNLANQSVTGIALKSLN
jgi:hypothetical protein